MARNKILIWISLITLTVLSLLFLIFNTKDTLKNSVPESAVFYFHTTRQFFDQQTPPHQQLLLSQSKQTGLTTELLKQIINLTKDEVGFFKLPQEKFKIITKGNSELESLLTQNQLGFYYHGKNLIFPENTEALSPETFRSLTKNKLFKPRKFNFSGAYVFYSGIEPFFAYFTTNKSQLIAKTSLQLPTMPRYIPQIQNWPQESSLVMRNFDFSGLFTPTKNQLTPLNYLILQKLPQLAEVAIYRDQLIARSHEINQNKITGALKMALAITSPKTEIKRLPDGTIAKQLLANPQAFEFQKSEPDGFLSLLLPESTIELMIQPDDAGTTITATNLTSSFNWQAEQNSTEPNQLEVHLKQCGAPLSSFVYFRPNLNIGISSLVIFPTILSKMSVCID